tara:strand:+ start:307 stop:600 length:294 start_codon:yes stop_codon:yes gene_type:complete
MDNNGGKMKKTNEENMQTTTFIMKNGKKIFYQNDKGDAIRKFRSTSGYKDKDVKFIKTEGNEISCFNTTTKAEISFESHDKVYKNALSMILTGRGFR